MKDPRRRKGLKTFIFGKDITKNKIGVFENNDNLTEIYFIIYQNSGTTASKYLDYITLYTENDINITIDAYYETNKCYKFSDNRTHLFNFELRDFENYYLQYQIYSKSQKTISYVFKNKNNEKIDNVGNQYLAAETNHLADGGKVNVEGRQPSYKVKSSDVDDTDICKLLPSQTPVRIAVECQRDAHYTTAHQSEEPRNGFLAVHHVSEHIGSMGYANARHQQRGKYQPR